MTELEKSDARDIALPGAMLTRTGIQFDPDLAFEHWEAIGSHLERADAAVQWWVGDWLCYGDDRPEWGDKYEQAVSSFNRSYDTIANYKSVARRVDPSRRRETLPWSYHEAVAVLEPHEQDALLGLCEPEADDLPPRRDRNWLRDQVRERRKEQDGAEEREERRMRSMLGRAWDMLMEALKWFEFDLACATLEEIDVFVSGERNVTV